MLPQAGIRVSGNKVLAAVAFAAENVGMAPCISLRTLIGLTSCVCLLASVGWAQLDLLPDKENSISPADLRILYGGRFDMRSPARPRMGYPGTTVTFRFTGSSLTLKTDSSTADNSIAVIVDGGEPKVYHLRKGLNEIVVAQALDPSIHRAEIVKRTETWQGILTFLGIVLEKDMTLVDPPVLPRRKLMFIGDSVTCGEGVDHTPTCKEGKAGSANAYDSYGMILGRRLDAQVHLVCFGGRGVLRDYRGYRDVLNGPQFFDLALPAEEPAGRVAWDHSQWTPDGIFVSLGTNDLNLQKTDPLKHDEFVNTYVQFVRQIRARYPNALIFLTEGAIVTDPLLRTYVQETAAKVADVRVQWVESRHYPGGACDGHPTGPQHKSMAGDLEPALRKGLGW